MTPEKEIQNSIMSYFKKLKASGIDNYVERRQAGGFAYKMGLPDLWVVIFGKHIEIEVKRPGGQPRATQEKWARRFTEMGAIYICADAVSDVANIVEMLMREYLSKGGNA